jgi:hypothetical protein
MVPQLSLEFPDTNNLKTLRITDGSFYNPKIEVECGILEITPPGYVDPVIFNVKDGFSTVFNASNLKLSKVKVYSKLNALPDGVYKVKYSVKPNEDLWIEYEYLRINKFLKDYNEQLCKLKLQPAPITGEVKDRIKHLIETKIYVEAGKVEVEECGNRLRGIELYNYGQKLLAKLKTIDCLTC